MRHRKPAVAVSTGGNHQNHADFGGTVAITGVPDPARDACPGTSVAHSAG